MASSVSADNNPHVPASATSPSVSSNTTLSDGLPASHSCAFQNTSASAHKLNINVYNYNILCDGDHHRTSYADDESSEIEVVVNTVP